MSLEKSFVETKQDPVTYAHSAIPCLAKDHLTYTECGVRSSLVKRGREEKVNYGTMVTSKSSDTRACFA